MRLSHLIILLLAIVCVSTSVIFIRLAAAPALVIVFWRSFLAWPALAGVAAVRKEKWYFKKSIAAGALLAVHWIFWVAAIKTTTIASAALLVSTGVLWSAVLSRPLLGEAVTRHQWIGLSVALAGVTLILFSNAGGRHTFYGDGLALLSSLCWVGYTFIGRRARKGESFAAYTASVYCTCALTVLILILPLSQPLISYNLTTWLALAGLALFPTLLGHGSVNYLLRFIGPVNINLWALLEPVLAGLYAWPLFGEIPSTQVMLGGLITLAGVAIGIRVKNGKLPAPV